MSIRKILVFLLTVVFLLSGFSMPVLAADDPVLSYELTVDGLETKNAEIGDIVTVTLHLQRTDLDAPYIMYAMQSEIRYDSTFFELVEDSVYLYDGVQSSDIARESPYREFYMNYVSLSGGVEWQARTRVGSFQLRVIGTEGVSAITNEDFLVSKPDGSGSYACESNEIKVILTTDCTIKFETNGGTPIDPINAIYGETISRPEDPKRDGKYLVGWYKDIHLTQEWNFETDTVKGSMTLYAKWADGKAPGTFGKDDFFNMDWMKNIPIVPIGIGFGVLVLLVLLWLLIRWLLVLLGSRKYIMYSLVNGDISLNYRNDYRNAHVTLVLNKENTSYTLGGFETTEEDKTVRYIENGGNAPIVHIEPGVYDGKLIIKDDYSVMTSTCQIKVVDKELKQKK